MNATDLAFDGIVDDAIEILLDRALTTIATPTNVGAWKARTRSALHAAHSTHAYELLTADLDHSGTVTITPRTLANLLVPPPEAPTQPAGRYDDAERRRRQRDADAPEAWLDPETRARCLAEARAALAAARAEQANAVAAAKAAKDAEGDEA